MIEALLGVSAFFILLFLTCDTALVFMRAATAQFIVSKEARSSLAFYRLVGMTPAQIKQRIRDRAAELGVDASQWEISICTAASASPNCTSDSLGSATDLLLFKVDPKLRFLAGTVPLYFTASVLISREATV